MIEASDALSATPDVGPTRLRMPWPDAEFAPCATTERVPVGVCPPAPAASPAALAWYRWVLGHHLSFCVWRLMVETLVAVEAGVPTAEADLVGLYNSYSALLLYAGSCSTEIYGSVLRTRMRTANPAMSGTWARDYRAVQTRLANWPAGAAVRAAVKFNRLVHMSVGKRLVAEGASLLRDAGRSAQEQPTTAECDVVDAFFDTDRTAVCVHEFHDQVELRVGAALGDLAADPVLIHYERAAIAEFQTDMASHIQTPKRVAASLLSRGDQ